MNQKEEPTINVEKVIGRKDVLGMVEQHVESGLRQFIQLDSNRADVQRGGADHLLTIQPPFYGTRSSDGTFLVTPPGISNDQAKGMLTGDFDALAKKAIFENPISSIKQTLDPGLFLNVFVSNRAEIGQPPNYGVDHFGILADRERMKKILESALSKVMPKNNVVESVKEQS